MKKILIILLLSCFTDCTSSSEENGWWLYYNFKDGEQRVWDLKTLPEKNISIKEFNGIDLEELDLDENMLITDDMEKEKLFDLIPFTYWTVDSSSYEPLNLGPVHREDWLYLEKQRLEKEVNLYTLGNIEFVSGIKSVLIAKQYLNDNFYKLTLLIINIHEGRVVSIVETGEYGDFISLSILNVKTTVNYNKKNKQFKMHEIRKSLFMDGICTSEDWYDFRIDSQGRIISKH